MVNNTRRRLLKTGAGVGVIGLTGCLGGGDQDSEPTDNDGDGGGDGGDGGGDGNGGDGSDEAIEVVFGHAGSGTSGGTVVEALRRAVSQQSDTVTISTVDTGGDISSMYFHDDGNIDASPSNTYLINQAVNDEGPFEERAVDDVLMQGWNERMLEVFFIAPADSDIESTADLDGRDVYLIDPAWGLRAWAEGTVFTEYGLYERANEVVVDTSELAGAYEEGRIEAGIGIGVNFNSLHPIMNEIDARVDIKILELSDEFKQIIEDEPSAVLTESEPYAWNQDVGRDTYQGAALPYNLWYSGRLPNEAVYELARISHEHHDIIREGAPWYPDHSDVETMTRAMIDAVPVHPGMEEFLRDHDAWDDSWPSAND